MNSVLPLFVWLAVIHGLVEFSPLRPGEYWLLKLQPAAPLSDELTPSTRWGWFRQLGSHAAAIGILMLLLAGRNLLDPTARHFAAISLRLAWPWFILLTVGLHVAVDLGTRLIPSSLRLPRSHPLCLGLHPQPGSSLCDSLLPRSLYR
ncbi:MAG: hypothetical protein IMX00_02285 [Limnochordales bacterium]|nr:hypothetical protein [Limnochordales bacterium]